MSGIKFWLVALSDYCYMFYGDDLLLLKNIFELIYIKAENVFD